MNTKVTVTFTREVCEDNDTPDLSWLDQTDKEMGEGFEANAAERKRAYARGDWHMIGIRAKAAIEIHRPGYTTTYELTSPGLWGIESDSSEDYLTQVFNEECATLRDDIAAMRSLEFK